MCCNVHFLLATISTKTDQFKKRIQSFSLDILVKKIVDKSYVSKLRFFLLSRLKTTEPKHKKGRRNTQIQSRTTGYKLNRRVINLSRINHKLNPGIALSQNGYPKVHHKWQKQPDAQMDINVYLIWRRTYTIIYVYQKTIKSSRFDQISKAFTYQELVFFQTQDSICFVRNS